MKIQAVNVLGEAGSYPFLRGVESDEYRTSLQFEYGLSVGDALPSLSLVLQNLATFYGSGSRDSLNMDNRLSWKRDASTTAWSESLDLSLSLRRERSWLLDLYGLAIGVATKPHNASIRAEAKAGAGASGPTAVSAWLQALGASSPVCRTILAVVADVDSTTDDGKANVLSLSASESATWKLVFKDLLSLGCTASLVQSRSGDTGIFVVGPKLELTATVSF